MSGIVCIGGVSGGIDVQAAVRSMLNRYDAVNVNILPQPACESRFGLCE